MDTLLPIKPQLLPAPTLLLQRGRRRPIRCAPVRRADQVDGRGEVRGARGGGDGRPREEELC